MIQFLNIHHKQPKLHKLNKVKQNGKKKKINKVQKKKANQFKYKLKKKVENTAQRQTLEKIN
jgi:hypothetical protein